MTDDPFSRWVRSEARHHTGSVFRTGLPDDDSAAFGEMIRRAGRRGIVRTVEPVADRPPTAYERAITNAVDPVTGRIEKP